MSNEWHARRRRIWHDSGIVRNPLHRLIYRIRNRLKLDRSKAFFRGGFSASIKTTMSLVIALVRAGTLGATWQDSADASTAFCINDRHCGLHRHS